METSLCPCFCFSKRGSFCAGMLNFYHCDGKKKKREKRKKKKNTNEMNDRYKRVSVSKMYLGSQNLSPTNARDAGRNHLYSDSI